MFHKKNRSEEDERIYLKVYAGFHTLEKWIRLKQKQKVLTPFFRDNNITEIAIYGMGELGQLFLDELTNVPVKVICGIDMNIKDKDDLGIKVVDFHDVEQYKDIQAIVVTPVQYFDNIKQQLGTYTDATIICLDDVLDYCLEEV